MLENLKTALRSTFVYSIGNLSSKLLGLILIPVYTDKLTVSEYGILGMLEITAQVFTAVFGMSLFNAFFRWYWDKEYQGKQKSMYFTILVSVLILSLFLNIFFWPLHGSFSNLLLGSADYAYLIMLILLISLLDAPALVTNTLVRLQEKPAFYTILQIAKILITLVFTVYFIAYKGKKVEGIYEAQLIGNAVYYLVVSRFILKNIEFRFERVMLKDMLRFSYPLLFTSLAGIILTISDRYVLRFISDLSYVGIYSLGFKIANTLRVFIITSVNLAIQPMIYKMIDQPDNKRFYSKIMTYFSYGLMICALGLSLFGRELIKFLSKTNPDYWEAFAIVPVISLAVFFGMLRDVSLTGINISKKTGVNARSIIFVAVMNIGLNILLIPSFGYMGAAVATLISQMVYFLFIYYFAQKYYPIKYEITKVIKIIGSGILIYSISLLTNDMSLFARLLIKSLLIISFPFILYPLKFYEPIELNRLYGFWLKWRNPSNWRNNI
jgi:O-antigen/teichoic acid export membrane protein